MLTAEQISEMVTQANQQSTEQTTPTVVASTTPTLKVKEGEIIVPKQAEYKTDEQLREEASQLAIQSEKDTEILELQTKLDDDSISVEDKEVIKLKLKELNPEDFKEKANEAETPEQELIRIKQELEDLKSGKKEITDNPLKEIEDKAVEKGIEITELYKEYVLTGELSEASYNSLIEAGFNDTAIKAYIDTRTNIEQTKAIEVMTDVTGSVENYHTMVEWMKSNLTQAEIDNYDKGVNSEHYNTYVENMYNKFSKATTEPVIIRNNGYVSNSEKQLGFKSINEQNLAMADSRYGNDNKYTTEVRNKVLNSTY